VLADVAVQTGSSGQPPGTVSWAGLCQILQLLSAKQPRHWDGVENNTADKYGDRRKERAPRRPVVGCGDQDGG
jgi:hypothetical protein